MKMHSVGVSSFSFGILWRQKRCPLNHVAISTSVTEHGGLHTSAVDYCLCDRFLFPLIIRQSS